MTLALLTQPETYVSLLTLTAMEVVLGIDTLPAYLPRHAHKPCHDWRRWRTRVSYGVTDTVHTERH